MVGDGVGVRQGESWWSSRMATRATSILPGRVVMLHT